MKSLNPGRRLHLAVVGSTLVARHYRIRAKHEINEARALTKQEVRRSETALKKERWSKPCDKMRLSLRAHVHAQTARSRTPENQARALLQLRYKKFGKRPNPDEATKLSRRLRGAEEATRSARGSQRATRKMVSVKTCRASPCRSKDWNALMKITAQPEIADRDEGRKATLRFKKPKEHQIRQGATVCPRGLKK